MKNLSDKQITQEEWKELVNNTYSHLEWLTYEEFEEQVNKFLSN